MDIQELKNGIKDQKPAEGKNISGNELRDFGDGLKEFDPAANGFEPEKVEMKESDKDRALNGFVNSLQARQDEVDRYNDLLDQYGGSITEEELREELGQSNITKILRDGTGDKYEDPDNEATVNAKKEEEAVAEAAKEEEPATSSELEELEAELAAEDETTTNIEHHSTYTLEYDNGSNRRWVAHPTSIVADDIAPTPVENKKEEDTDTLKKADDITPTAEKVESPKEDDMSQEDADLAALDDVNAAPVEDFDSKLKVELEKKMKPVSRKLDLSNITIVNKAVSVSSVLNTSIPIDRRVYTWALMKSGRPITMKGFTASELNTLQSTIADARTNQPSRETIKQIWDHIVYKGPDFDAWCKSTAFQDLEHIWFAIYGACFGNSNYVPFSCPSCNELTVSSTIPITDMCKYKNDEVKEKVSNIINMPPVSTDAYDKFATYLVQISDYMVVAFKEPSIYDVIIFPSMFDAEFRRKYDDAISMCVYVDQIYAVGYGADKAPTLAPIDVKKWPNNETKSMKAKVIQYAKILRSLPSDQYNIILKHISNMNEEPELTYELPAITCDHCKAEIPAEQTAASELVFMRHRLGMLGA